MVFVRTAVSSLVLVALAGASPLELARVVARDITLCNTYPTTTRCGTHPTITTRCDNDPFLTPTGTVCPDGPWTADSVCTRSGDSDAAFVSSIRSKMTSPPPPGTTFNPSSWCSDYLQHTDYVIPITYTHGTSTTTIYERSLSMFTRTTTDTVNPTATIRCPRVNPSAECDWDSWVLDWITSGGIFSGSSLSQEECEQGCLANKDCKTYHVGPRSRYGNTTQIYDCWHFDRPIDENWKGRRPSQSGKPAGNYGWWERGCADNVPSQCNAGKAIAPTPAAKQVEAREPVITPAPQLVDRTGTHVEASNADADVALAPRNKLEKRKEKPLPEYMSINNLVSYSYMTMVCSCIITKALPATTLTTQSTVLTSFDVVTTTVTLGGAYTVTETSRPTTTVVTVD